MKNWFMLAIVGRDQPGIVARVTQTLFDNGCHLGEASMARLGGSFTIMMMVNTDHNIDELQAILQPVISELGLQLHIDSIRGELHHHIEPNVCITVFGADRPGIVAQVTGPMSLDARLAAKGPESQH